MLEQKQGQIWKDLNSAQRYEAKCLIFVLLFS